MSQLNSKTTDSDLLMMYQNGVYEAFDVFFRRHKKLVFNFLLKKLKQRENAEDAFQETFMRIHKYILKFDPSKNALGWVFGIANNVAIDTAKRNTYRGPSFNDEMPNSDSTNNDEFAKIEASLSLENLLADLRESDRNLLMERFLSNDSFEDIAKRMNSRPDSIRQRFSRILKKIRSNQKN